MEMLNKAIIIIIIIIVIVIVIIIIIIIIIIHVLAFVFCRIVFLTRGKITPLSVLFIKETFISTATTVARDGSSPSMAPSAAVLCPLMSLGGWIAVATATTDLEQ